MSVAQHFSGTQTEWRDAYLKSRSRYVAYYIEIRNGVGIVIEEEAEVELANLQQAFQLSLETDLTLPLQFWEVWSGFLYEHGYWRHYLEWGERALEILQPNESPKAEAWLLSELGWVRLDQGEYAIAKALLDRAERIFETIDDWKGTSIIQRYQGVLAYRTGKLELALEYYKQAGQIAIAHESWLMLSEIRNLQGSVARKKGDFPNARQLYEESVALVKRTGDKWRLTAVTRNLARLDMLSGNLEVAVAGFTDTIDLCRQLDRKDMLYGCQFGLAETEYKLGHIDRARELAIAARDGFIELGMKKDLEEANRFLSTFDG